jgi:hypothetical protein
MKEYKNEDYVEFIDESLYLLIIRTDNKEVTSRIKKKLKGSHLDSFNEIISHRSLIEFASIAYKSVPYNLENLEKKDSLLKLKQQAEELFSDYLNSVDKFVFLEAISEITYWLAKVEGARQIKIHEDFLSSWLQWHRYLERKNKNKREGQKTKEKLRIILGDKIDDIAQIYSEHIDDVERFESGKKNIFVNIDQEIDVGRAESSSLLFLPERWLSVDDMKFRVIEEHTECVLIDGKKYSLREYYEIVKSEIGEGWLKSKDLLKQIITIYLIKRCQNGDEEAFSRLFNLYRDKAERVELSYIKERRGLIDVDEVKGRGSTILTSLLKGDDPSYPYKALEYSRSDKQGLDPLNKKPYDALNESYKSMFAMISGQLAHLTNELENLEKNTKDFRSRSRKARKTRTKQEYFEKTFVLSHRTLAKINFAPTIFMLFNPLDFLKISPKYNKYLFRPVPDGNLTTWLFGDKDKTFRGKVWDSLSNLFDGRNREKTESFDENEYIEDNSGLLYRKINKNRNDD